MDNYPDGMSWRDIPNNSKGEVEFESMSDKVDLLEVCEQHYTECFYSNTIATVENMKTKYEFCFCDKGLVSDAELPPAVTGDPLQCEFFVSTVMAMIEGGDE
jgi:hypothetical protein